jgi:NAD(P)-dependent dehydrogenase (short-subunit alcohol dehydrogenase family)
LQKKSASYANRFLIFNNQSQAIVPLNNNQKVAIVTGSSSGIGFETALALARASFRTFATMRNLAKGESLLQIAKKENLALSTRQLDVDNDQSVATAVKEIQEEAQRIDVLVNNAGFLLVGAIEDLSMQELRNQFETNFFGAVRLIKAVLPVMRKQKSGAIVNITSMWGRVAIPLDPAYHATKFALEGLSESIRYETMPFGIKVIAIEPGAVVGTNFSNNLRIANKAMDPSAPSPYSEMFQSFSTAARQMLSYAIPPSDVAKVIVNAVTSDNPDFRYILGQDAAQTLEAAKKMPHKDFEAMIQKQFFG